MLGDMDTEERAYYIRFCYEHRKRCYCQTTLGDILLMSSEKISLSDMTLQLFRNCGLTMEQRLVKRTSDILFSLLICGGIFLAVCADSYLYQGGQPWPG